MTLGLAVRAIPAMGPAYAQKLRRYVEKYKTDLDGMLEQNPYGVPIGTRGWAGNSQVIGWATTNYYLHKAYPDLVGTDLVTRGLDYIFGTDLAHNYSFVSAVGKPLQAPRLRQQPRGLQPIARAQTAPAFLVLKPTTRRHVERPAISGARTR